MGVEFVGRIDVFYLLILPYGVTVDGHYTVFCFFFGLYYCKIQVLLLDGALMIFFVGLYADHIHPKKG